MRYRFISIENEYGSGGEIIAEELASLLHLPCHYTDISEELAFRLGLTTEQMAQLEQRVTDSFIYSLYSVGSANMFSPSGSMLSHNIFQTEQEIIGEMAEAGGGVFLGHCAGVALRERSDHLGVLIRADEPDKRHRVIQDYGIDSSRAVETMMRKDKNSANYFFTNSGKRWSDIGNYDLVLNTSRLGIQQSIELLRMLAEMDE